MLQRPILVCLVLVLLLCLGTRANPLPAGYPSWMALPPISEPHRPIGLIFHNTSIAGVEMGNTAPWRIVGEDLVTEVYAPEVVDSSLVEILDWECVPWAWHQLDNGGSQVAGGTYYAVISWWFAVEGPESLRTSYTKIRVLDGVSWTVEPDPVEDDSYVSLTLANRTPGDTLLITDTDPWFITDTEANPIYDPGGMPWPDIIPPGWSKSWIWDLDDNYGSPAGPGDYLARIDYHNIPGTRRARPTDLFTIVPSAAGEVVWVVEPRVNGTKSAVTLSLTNASPDTIYLPDTAPWHVEDDEGARIYMPFASPVIIPLPPGVTIGWGWDERGDDRSHVPAGDYTAVARYYPDIGDSLERKSFDFTLVEPDTQVSCVFAEPDTYWYALGDTVGFTFRNCVPDTIGMFGVHTWWIANEFGVPVHSPEILWSLMHLGPSEGFRFLWDQTDMVGGQVPAGIYYAHIAFTDKQFATQYVVLSKPVIVGHLSGLDETSNSAGRLDQNYPNPAGKVANIRYSIAERTHVNLRVYNVKGQLVRTLVDEVQEPSAHGYLAIWDGEDESGRRVASGVYFYKLETGALVQTRKMVLVR